LAALCGQSDAVELRVDRAAFLDLETTGLSRGSGTYAFLIGAGRFEGDVFCVRQFFMREPCEEAAQLEALAQWLADIDGVITFNGRSFDVPVLSCRQSCHGLPAFLQALPNLDLLPAARRLFGRRLRDCSLGSLERQLLSFEREDDVPGWLVPERYLTYQRTGDARPLVGVFRHNLFDVLSMVTLTSRLARAFATPHGVLEHGCDWLGLARVYGRAGDRCREMGAYESALSVGLDQPDAEDALCRLALAAKRAGDWPRAVAVWQSMVETCAQRLAPFEELAKYYEHRAAPRELERALAVCLMARQRLANGSLRPARGRARGLADVDRRLARLRRRLGTGQQ
jgi:hypothetical protein